MAGWEVPERSELLPLADEQTCEFCGSGDWRLAYLLLNAPDWVQSLPWLMNWVIVACAECHADLEAGRDAALAARYARHPYRAAAMPEFAEFLRVFLVRVSEPALSREDAQRA